MLRTAGDDPSSAKASPVRKSRGRKRMKRIQEPDGQLQSNAASTSRESKEEESMGFSPSIDFKIPTTLPSEFKLQMADSQKVMDFWLQEQRSIEESFSWFIGEPYFINKFGFLQVLLKKFGPGVLFACYAIFLPSGCGKTVMSMALEHFYSKGENHQTTKHLYSEFLDEEQLMHAGKYFVLRMSFRDIVIDLKQSFETTMIIFIKNLIIRKEPEIKKENIFRKGNSLYGIVREMVRFLYRKHGRMVVIIDEVDSPAVKYAIKNATPKQMDEMTTTFKSLLNGFAACSSDKNNYLIHQVILFGIHQPDGILETRTWTILNIFNKKTCASYFLFNITEVTTLLEKFGLHKELSEVEKHYGNYNGEYFLPASVVAFLKNDGQFQMYKSIRRSYDILNLDLPWVQCMLLEFLDNTTHCKSLDWNHIRFSRSRIIENNPLIQYILAGLICIKFPANDSSDVQSTSASKTANKGDYFDFNAEHELFAGNLENLNIIQFFVEKAVGIFSNPEVLNEIYNALLHFDFEKLTDLLNDMYSTFLHLESVNERAFRIAMKVFFYFVPMWKTKTEDEMYSGRTDMRIFNEKERILYILELKHVKPMRIQYRVPLEHDKEVRNQLDEAFKQIIDRGYVFKDDPDCFNHIFEVAVACKGKLIVMEARKHKSRPEPEPEPEPLTPLT